MCERQRRRDRFQLCLSRHECYDFSGFAEPGRRSQAQPIRADGVTTRAGRHTGSPVCGLFRDADPFSHSGSEPSWNRRCGAAHRQYFSSDGVWVDPPGFIASGVAAVQEAGGLVIADEVQPGFGRTGACMWGFERHGIVRILLPLASRWATDFRLALSLVAEHGWTSLVPPLAIRTHSLETQSE